MQNGTVDVNHLEHCPVYTDWSADGTYTLVPALGWSEHFEKPRYRDQGFWILGPYMALLPESITRPGKGNIRRFIKIQYSIRYYPGCVSSLVAANGLHWQYQQRMML